MLSEIWLFVGGLLVFIGLLASDGLLMVVGSLGVVVLLAARMRDKYAFRTVTHSRSLVRHRAVIGDNVDYTVTLNNGKVLSLIWVDIQDDFPEGLELRGAVMRVSGMGATAPLHHYVATTVTTGHLGIYAALGAARLPPL